MFIKMGGGKVLTPFSEKKLKNKFGTFFWLVWSSQQESRRQSYKIRPCIPS